MDKEKEIEEMAKVFCVNGIQCKYCGNTGFNPKYCGARKVAKTLINAGYGNVKQAVKEFAEKVKRIIYESDCEEPVCWKIEDKIDNIITELYGDKYRCDTCPDNNDAEWNENTCPLKRKGLCRRRDDA